MNDFRATILAARREAVVAGIKAEKCRNEVDSVLLELNDQLATEFHGTVVVIRLPASLAVVYGSTERELCGFAVGVRGYPIDLRYAKRTVSVYDRESLVGALTEFLGTIEAGAIFNELLGAPKDVPR